MGKKASPAVIGAFVLGAVALLVLAVTIWGSGSLFKKGRSYVCYFPGSVNGLGVGAAVKFRGVQIGEVSDLRLRHAQVRGEPRIPVYVEVDDGRMRDLGGAGAPEGRAFERIVADGLRARLQNQSIVTGVLYVELDLVPGSPLDLVQASDATPPEIPTLPTPLEEAARSVGDILAQLKEVDWKGISKSVTKVVASVERLVDTPELKQAIARLPETLDAVRELASRLDTRTATLATSAEQTSAAARRAVETLRTTLEDVQGLVAPDAPLAVELTHSIDDLGQAARALRDLAEYLERNPSAVVFGRPEGKP